MFPFDLFDSRSTATTSGSLGWTGGAKPADGDTGLDRFVAQPVAQPPEISAAWLATSDLSQ